VCINFLNSSIHKITLEGSNNKRLAASRKVHFTLTTLSNLKKTTGDQDCIHNEMMACFWLTKFSTFLILYHQI